MKSNRGVLALLLTVLIWGSTFVVTKVALGDVGPFALSALRFIIAFALLAPLAHRQGYSLRQSFQPTFLLFGLTGVALYYGLQNLALTYTSAVNTVLVLTIIPAVTALFAVWFLKERLAPLQILGIVFALAGMAIVGLSTGDSRDAPNPVLGNILVAGSVLAWVAYTIQGKHLSGNYPALVTTTASFGAGLLILIPFGVGEVCLSGLPHLTLAGVAAILYLALIATAIPMFLWNYALNTLDASYATLYLNLIPIVGVIIALVAGEAISLWQLLGGALTLAGVYVSGRFAPPSRR